MPIPFARRRAMRNKPSSSAPPGNVDATVNVVERGGGGAWDPLSFFTHNQARPGDSGGNVTTSIQRVRNRAAGHAG